MRNTNPADPTPPVDPRLLMAAERTFLAWVRTGIALMAFGFVIARIETVQSKLSIFGGGEAGSLAFSLVLGISLAATGIAVLVVAAWRHQRYVEALSAHRFSQAFRSRFALSLAAVLALLGSLLLLYLVLH